MYMHIPKPGSQLSVVKDRAQATGDLSHAAAGLLYTYMYIYTYKII